MKKRIAFRKLNRTPAHKWSMLRNQVSSLIEHERIVTTEAKAKELRHLADHVITLAKRGLQKGVIEKRTNQGAKTPGVGNGDEGATGAQKDGVKNSPRELHNRRRAAAIVRGDWNVSKLFDVLGPRYQFRDGGYTRVMKLAQPRNGDNAPMAIIEYVDRPGEIRAARPPSSMQRKINGLNTPMAALENALREMGIPAVDDVLTSEEQDQVKKQL